MAILPLLFVRKCLNKDHAENILESDMKIDIRINPLLNYLLLGLTRFEQCIEQLMPNVAGGSLLLVAEKDAGKDK